MAQNLIDKSFDEIQSDDTRSDGCQLLESKLSKLENGLMTHEWYSLMD